MAERDASMQPAVLQQAGAGEFSVGAQPADEQVTPSTQACAGPELPGRRKRACKSRRVRLEDADADSDAQEDDKYSNEMLQKRLRTLTDEKEIKKLKRLLRNRVSAQEARERKKRYINDLEDQMKDKDKEIQTLNTQLKKVTEENKSLASDNKTLRRLIVTMRGSSQPMQRAAPGASASRMGRPVRVEGPHGTAATSGQPVPRGNEVEQNSSESRENATKVPGHE